MINFERYDVANPIIWEMFVQYSKLAKEKGFKNYSANGIFEIIRWNTSAHGDDMFKINNIYRADFARKMMMEYPEFNGFFRVREVKASRIKFV